MIDFQPIVSTAIFFPASCCAEVTSLLAGRTKSKTCAGYCSQTPTTGIPASIADVRSPCQPEGAWVHYGLTSSDVVDTALALQMTRALDRILAAATDLESAIAWHAGAGRRGDLCGMRRPRVSGWTDRVVGFGRRS